MFREFVVSLARLAYRVLSSLVPRRRDKLCFVSYPDYTDNAKAMSDFYLAQDGWDLVWLTSNTTRVEVIDPRLRQVKKNSLKGLFEFLSATAVFYTHGTYFFASNGGPLQINLWHGMPIKNIGLLDNKKPSELFYADYSIATSGYFQNKIANAFGLSPARVWLSGLPRNDQLLTASSHIKTRLFGALGLSIDQECLFWLPTFRTSNQGDTRSDSKYATFLDEWADTFLDELNQAASAAKRVVLIKLHPMDSLNAQGIDKTYSHVKIIRSSEWLSFGIDLYAALGVSSALVSDVSSVLIDYLITGKPIGLTTASVQGYQRGLMDDVATLISGLPTLASSEAFLAFVTDPRQHVRQQDLSLFYSEYLSDARATERVAKLVRDALEGEVNVH